MVGEAGLSLMLGPPVPNGGEDIAAAPNRIDPATAGMYRGPAGDSGDTNWG